MIPVPTDADIQLQRAFADVENRLNTLEKTPRDQEPPVVVVDPVPDERVLDGDTVMDGSLEIGDDLEVLGNVNAPHLYEGLIKVVPEGLDGVIAQRTINMQASLAIVPGSLSADTVRCRRLDVNEKDSYLLPDPTYVSYVDDFIHGNAVSGSAGILNWNYYESDAGASIVQYAGDANHPGCVYMQPSAVAGNTQSLYANLAVYPMLWGITEFRNVWVHRDHQNAVGDMDVRFGIMDNVNYGSITNGIHFYLDTAGHATNWVARTMSASSNTDTATGIAWSASAWHKFEIWYTAASVKFYIDGALVATHTTNIPTTNDMMPCWSTRRQAAEQNPVLDYYSMTYKVAR